ncbi:MAG: tRNA uridine-5-carboxymethylaminomethyl(34) synthesis GTPase MnmE [Candidatus Aminicenantes bacterium]|nr:tRNA uridine-5-carboxymethylaminomethyl(34) synthesis GTPase MnmE [Candidatus Aminicenantes bacterium]
MLDQTLEDTIIAVSTPPGYGGIGIVRLSGRDALKIAKAFFRPKKATSKIPPRRAVLGNLVNLETEEVFEEAYLLYFQAPHSYTREDVAEISCHGSPTVMEEAVRLGIRAGARHARAGEFTLRAYLRGRLDIIQAEAVNDLIRAGTIETAHLAFSQLDGKLSKKIEGFRAGVIDILSQIEAVIEFPEDRLPVTPGKMAINLEKMIVLMDDLVSSYEGGRALIEGVTLAITGRTNVGKSTLFNAILEDERAIVTPYPGTTRDYLKEKIKIKDAYFNLVDMAGLGKAGSSVEREGMRRGEKIASSAEGLLILLDASRPEDREDLALLEEFRNKKALILFNKIDLGLKMDIAKIKERFGHLSFLEISALRGTNLNRLRKKIYEIFAAKMQNRENVIFHLRQKLLLEDVLRHLKKGRELLLKGHSEEIYADEIRKTLPFLSQLTGEIKADDVIERIFSRFCVGK